MRRREFITLLGGGAVAWGLAADAQDRPPRRILTVSIGGDPANPVFWRPFFERMQQLGYADGSTVVSTEGLR